MEEDGGRMTVTGRCCCVLLPTEDEDGEGEGSIRCCCFIICEVVAGSFGRYLGTTRRVVAVCPPPPTGTFADDDDDKTGCGTGAERDCSCGLVFLEAVLSFAAPADALLAAASPADKETGDLAKGEGVPSFVVAILLLFEEETFEGIYLAVGGGMAVASAASVAVAADDNLLLLLGTVTSCLILDCIVVFVSTQYLQSSLVQS